ncbi:hypothetical protein WN55_08317 [Dufourea novaeangliae]|uniref:Uncharacterized protein n=1 Tax=Dufourea novaeangliae TaxID=178035 RepID=A0A154P6H8_DUFNO|nr:hypothetical protein WN55_08317 [Dufourea novaeangliae]
MLSATKGNDNERRIIPRRQRAPMFSTDERSHGPSDSNDIQTAVFFVRTDQAKILGLDDHFIIANDDPRSKDSLLSRHVSRAHRKQSFPLNLRRLRHFETPVLVHPTTCQLTDFTTSDSVSRLLSCSLLLLLLLLPLSLTLCQRMRAHNTKSLLPTTDFSSATQCH